MPRSPRSRSPTPKNPARWISRSRRLAEVGADVAIVNDPDADRCAIAVVLDRERLARILSGQRGGVSAGWRAAQRCNPARSYAASIVVVAGTARDHGAQLQRPTTATTLTGFKWIGRVPDLAFGYEEALGYCCDPKAVPDKDGITTLLRVLTLVAGLKAAGKTVADRLAEIQHRYGLHLTSQLAFRVSDLSLIADAMARARNSPPATLAGEQVDATDLALGSDALPPTDGMLFEGGSVRVVVRPSGTEPKLKCYLQVRLAPEDSQDLDAARARASESMARARADMTAALGL